MRTYTEIFSPDGGYVVGNDSNGALTARAIPGPNNQPLHTMSALRLRALLREQERSFIVIAMHENPERIADYPTQTVGGKRYPAVQYRGDSGTFVVMFDPATHLPAIARTRDFDQLMGDANFDATFSDWRTVEQIKLPFHTLYTLGGVKVFESKIDSYVLNTSLATDAFNAPGALRGKAAKPAPISKVPYQWILRRLTTGFYLDSDALYTDDGGKMQLIDVAPNVSLVTGSTHNTLIVATDNYLVAFEAPGRRRPIQSGDRPRKAEISRQTVSLSGADAPPYRSYRRASGLCGRRREHRGRQGQRRFLSKSAVRASGLQPL